jgi:hypothetical protein
VSLSFVTHGELEIKRCRDSHGYFGRGYSCIVVYTKRGLTSYRFSLLRG